MCFWHVQQGRSVLNASLICQARTKTPMSGHARAITCCVRMHRTIHILSTHSMDQAIPKPSMGSGHVGHASVEVSLAIYACAGDDNNSGGHATKSQTPECVSGTHLHCHHFHTDLVEQTPTWCCHIPNALEQGVHSGRRQVVDQTCSRQAAARPQENGECKASIQCKCRGGELSYEMLALVRQLGDHVVWTLRQGQAFASLSILKGKVIRRQMQEYRSQ